MRGLDEHLRGDTTISAWITTLWEFLTSLNGVSLLVHVIRSNTTDIRKQDYRMFYEIFCRKKVPIVLFAADRDDRKWPRRSTYVFNYKSWADDYHCIIDYKGSERQFKSELEDMIAKYCGKVPRKIREDQSQGELLGYPEGLNDFDFDVLFDAFVNAGMSIKDAKEVALGRSGKSPRHIIGPRLT
jgi:hypothetical protein